MERQKYLEQNSYAQSKDSVRLIVTPNSIAKSMYFYVQEAGYFKTKYPYFIERRNVSSFLILYTISGKGFLEYKNRQYILTSGKCFYIDCMEYYYYHTRKRGNWEFLWLHFNGANAIAYFDEFSKKGFEILTMEENSSVKIIIEKIIAINQEKNSITEIQTSNLIDNLLTKLLLRSYNRNKNSIVIPCYIKDIIKDIKINFRETLTLDYFAQKYNRNKFYISKEFKKYMGTTINEYIINIRICHAKELLKYSNLSVHEIAYEVGIHHISHFINLFKAREDITPLSYRREWGTFV